MMRSMRMSRQLRGRMWSDTHRGLCVTPYPQRQLKLHSTKAISRVWRRGSSRQSLPALRTSTTISLPAASAPTLRRGRISCLFKSAPRRCRLQFGKRKVPVRAALPSLQSPSRTTAEPSSSAGVSRRQLRPTPMPTATTATVSSTSRSSFLLQFSTHLTLRRSRVKGRGQK